MTPVDVGSLSLDHPRALVRARGRPGRAGGAAREDDGDAACGRALRHRARRCRARRRRRRHAHARRPALGRRPRDAARHRVLDDDRTAGRARHGDPGRADRPERRDRVRRRPRHSRRYRPAGPDRAAGAAPHAQRQAADDPPGRARRRGARARGGRAVVPLRGAQVPTTGSDAAYALLAWGLLFCVLLTHRATRTFWLSRRPADLLIAVGCIWLGVSLVAQLVIGPMTLGYYLGHGLELAAVALIAIPAARDIARTGASFPLVGDLTATDLVASEEAYLGPRVRALMVRLAERDGSTEEHTRRVAILAAQVGEDLKLPATTRRHLAVGGCCTTSASSRCRWRSCASRPG